MTRGQNLEAMLSLAMLPVGAVLAVVSALAFFPLGFFALAVPFFGGVNWGWFELWLIAATLLAVRNTVASLEALSALAWPTALGVALSWAVLVLLWPGWYMARGAGG